MFNIALMIVAVLVAGIIIYAATKPNTFSIVRMLKINASPEKIFAEINDFNRWKAWSPWEKKDLSMQRIFSGSASGVGSVYEWNGNNNVGQGRMEIIESNAPQKITIKLDFFKPFEAHNRAEFTLKQEGEATVVRWEMHGPQPFIGKLMSIFMNMDKMVGTDFEAGLADLQKLTEPHIDK